MYLKKEFKIIKTMGIYNKIRKRREEVKKKKERDDKKWGQVCEMKTQETIMKQYNKIITEKDKRVKRNPHTQNELIFLP